MRLWGRPSREASAALALVTLATEPQSECVGFASGATPSRPALGNLHFRGITGRALSPRQRLDDAVRSIFDLPFGGTDAALPMMAALERGASFDPS